MLYFLLVISFIIDGIIIFALFTVFTKVKKTEEIELRQQEVAKEIEDLFSSYLLEIKEENSRFESKVIESSNNESETYKPPEPDKEEDYEVSTQSKVISLYNKGKSVDDIARELNLGVTETQLIVKFHKKK
ncbi:DUF6115 domain-containing protein [Halobacillus sp. Marseille-P3879]|uniref:DUF6115 domain-containing protein n=1 Tax=Halobacillus sp. Marseille-P3879 TaxID=2045014 RepID=UPI000C7C611F|nr:hypothetical protein [Halobacillus sp. Marseille-P3879]